MAMYAANISLCLLLSTFIDGHKKLQSLVGSDAVIINVLLYSLKICRKKHLISEAAEVKDLPQSGRDGRTALVTVLKASGGGEVMFRRSLRSQNRESYERALFN
jgi:hypothetical protein